MTNSRNCGIIVTGLSDITQDLMYEGFDVNLLKTYKIINYIPHLEIIMTDEQQLNQLKKSFINFLLNYYKGDTAANIDKIFEKIIGEDISKFGAVKPHLNINNSTNLTEEFRVVGSGIVTAPTIEFAKRELCRLHHMLFVFTGYYYKAKFDANKAIEGIFKYFIYIYTTKMTTTSLSELDNLLKEGKLEDAKGLIQAEKSKYIENYNSVIDMLEYAEYLIKEMEKGKNEAQ
jgi:hypothetical protein